MKTFIEHGRSTIVEAKLPEYTGTPEEAQAFFDEIGKRTKGLTPKKIIVDLKKFRRELLTKLDQEIGDDQELKKQVFGKIKQTSSKIKESLEFDKEKLLTEGFVDYMTFKPLMELMKTLGREIKILGWKNILIMLIWSFVLVQVLIVVQGALGLLVSTVIVKGLGLSLGVEAASGLMFAVISIVSAPITEEIFKVATMKVFGGLTMPSTVFAMYEMTDRLMGIARLAGQPGSSAAVLIGAVVARFYALNFHAYTTMMYKKEYDATGNVGKKTLGKGIALHTLYNSTLYLIGGVQGIVNSGKEIIGLAGSTANRIIGGATSKALGQ